MVIDASGRITWWPRQPGNYAVTVRVEDAHGAADTAVLHACGHALQPGTRDSLAVFCHVVVPQLYADADMRGAPNR